MPGKYLEEHISVRSYALWEREGRLAGREKEYRERARAEVEAELRAALEGEDNGFVPPRLPISQKPIRH